MGFFKNTGTESAILCKKLADFENLKTGKEQNIKTWSWPWSLSVYITRNIGACAVVRYLLDSKRINIDDFVDYIYRLHPQYNHNREAIKASIGYNYDLDKISVKTYNPKTKTLYCYGGPSGGMTDKHAERIFNDATELLKYLNIKYIKKGSYKQHNVRIVFN